MAKGTGSCGRPKDPVFGWNCDDRYFACEKGMQQAMRSCLQRLVLCLRVTHTTNIARPRRRCTTVLCATLLRVVLCKISKADAPRLGWRVWTFLVELLYLASVQRHGLVVCLQPEGISPATWYTINRLATPGTSHILLLRQLRQQSVSLQFRSFIKNRCIKITSEKADTGSKAYVGGHLRIPRPPICPAYSSMKLPMPVRQLTIRIPAPTWGDQPFLHYVTSPGTNFGPST